MQTTYLSKQGFKELHKEIQNLENENKTIVQQLRELGRAKSREDQFERSELISALEVNESKLSVNRETLKNAKPLPRKRDRLRVALGSVVDLVDQRGQLFRYTLVTSLEADPSDGKISIESPLGKTLLNHQKTDSINWSSGSRSRQLRLIDVS